MLGFLADIATTKLFVLALLVTLFDPGSSSQAPIHRINLEMLDWFCLCWGLFFTGLGGFIACRLAPRRGFLHASAVGYLALLFSHAEGWSPAQVGWELYLAGTLLSLPVAWLGAVLARPWRGR